MKTNTLSIRITKLICILSLTSLLGCGDSATNKPQEPNDMPEPDNDPIETIAGIDISADQPGLINTNLPDSISFVICKATEGETYTDPDFYSNLKTAQSKKLITGVYHFYHTADDPIVQANFFWQQVSKTTLPDMPLILDIEQGSFCEGKNCITPPVDTLQAQLLRFMNQLQKNCNCTPILYTDKGFINPFLMNEEFGKYPLWLAEYTTNGAPPSLPDSSPWKTWFMWQKSDSVIINRIQTDFDVYYGKKSNLMK